MKEILKSLLLIVMFLFVFAGLHRVYGQPCVVNSLQISTGYNPVTGSLLAPPAGNGHIPLNQDPKWFISYESAGITGAVGATTVSACWTGGSLVESTPAPAYSATSAADIVPAGGDVTGLYSDWINCMNSDFYWTDPTTAYYTIFSRTFTMAYCGYVRFNLNIARDNYISASYVDNPSNSLFSESPTAAVANYESFTPYVSPYFNLSCGTHTIYFVVYNEDVPAPECNPFGLNIYGSIESSGTSNLLVSESAACTSFTPCGIPTIAVPGTLCPGSNMTLTDEETGGTWSSSAPAVATAGASSGVVTGISAGSATITYADICGNTTYTTVTVNPAPAAPSVTDGDLTVCAGTTTTLTATASYSGSGTLSYTWTPTAAPCTYCDYDVVTPSVTTVYNVHALATYSGTVCASPVTTQTLTVNQMPPTPVITGTTVCTGSNVTLTVTPTPGFTGTWSSSNPAIATINATTGVATGIAAGTASIIYTLTGPGPSYCSSSFEYSLTVNTIPALPTIGESASSVYVGCSILLGGSPGIGGAITSVEWTLDAGPGSVSFSTPAAATTNVTGVTAGATTIYYTVWNACGPNSGATSISVLADPTITITGTATTICPGATLTVTATPTGGSWSATPALPVTIESPSSATTAVLGVNAGATTLVYTLPVIKSCNVTADYTMTVSPNPVVT